MPNRWRDVVSARASEEGADLPPGTIDELAAHIEDIQAAAIRRGATNADAERQALDALADSLAPLARHTRRTNRSLPIATANDTAQAASGRTLAFGYALRMVFRQCRHHPGFALAV